jgi:hypothetical protein
MNAPSNPLADDVWTVAGRAFRSRLIVGTGKYKDYAVNAAAVEAAGAEMVTVALRRVNLSDPNQPMLVDFIDPKRFTYLPNTAGCFTGEDAVRTLRLAREAGCWDLVKLEVLSDTVHLYPDMEETLRADRLGPGHPEPGQYPADRGAGQGAGGGGRRRGHALGRDPGHGAGLRRGADEHGYRRGQGPGAHGPRHEARGHRGQGRVPGRQNGQAAVRRSVLALGRVDLSQGTVRA